MQSDLEFLIVLLEQPGDSYVAQEDFDGPHGAALRAWQEMGFIGKDAVMNPVSPCPYCDEGTAYLLNGRYRCNECFSTVDRQHLLLWPVYREAFFRWLAGQLPLQGQVRQVDPALWQLGTLLSDSDAFECFYQMRGPLAQPAKDRMALYRHVVTLYGLSPPPAAADVSRGPCLSLLSVLLPGTPLAVHDAASLLSGAVRVRFESGSGELWIGHTLLGAVRVGTREYFFLEFLASRPDELLLFSEIKRHVQRQTGSTDATDEATFCHKLKNAIKRKIPDIDRVIHKTHKGDGYLFRGRGEA